MQCPKCHRENAPSRKFCAACGHALATRCDHCGVDNAPGDQFCGGCGAVLGTTAPAAEPRGPPVGAPARIGITAAVAPHDVPEGERKTVTALFADIKGSMELIEDLDPEEARAIIDPALTLMMEAVHRYDGHIAQSTGDGIFALFGAPVAAQAVPAGERKTVTALFADIKGSMELIEDLDPEEARRIIDPALQLMMEAVRRYDG